MNRKTVKRNSSYITVQCVNVPEGCRVELGLVRQVLLPRTTHSNHAARFLPTVPPSQAHHKSLRYLHGELLLVQHGCASPLRPPPPRLLYKVREQQHKHKRNKQTKIVANTLHGYEFHFLLHTRHSKSNIDYPHTIVLQERGRFRALAATAHTIKSDE